MDQYTASLVEGLPLQMRYITPLLMLLCHISNFCAFIDCFSLRRPVDLNLLMGLCLLVYEFVCNCGDIAVCCCCAAAAAVGGGYYYNYYYRHHHYYCYYYYYYYYYYFCYIFKAYGNIFRPTLYRP